VAAGTRCWLPRLTTSAVDSTRGRLTGGHLRHPARNTAKENIVNAIELATKESFTTEEARVVAAELGIDFVALGCDLEQFRMGMDVELEHGPRDPKTDVTGNDPVVTGKIALAHLAEFPDYYTRLAVLEDQAAAHLRTLR
jgi:Protein of unknown function (DUF5661)